MRHIFYISILLFLASCTSNTLYEKPKNLIPKDTMVSLLEDVLVAQSAKSAKNKFLERKVNYMPFVYNKYKIDSLRFIESNIYYTSKIEVYYELLQIVKKNLKKRKEIYDSKLTVENTKNRKDFGPQQEQELEVQIPFIAKLKIKELEFTELSQRYSSEKQKTLLKKEPQFNKEIKESLLKKGKLLPQRK